MENKIIEIDFLNEIHKQYINKLIKNNKFYQNDIKMQYLDDYDLDIFESYPSKIQKLMKQDLKKEIEKNYENEIKKGFFITTLKSNGRCGICGFILYNIDNGHYHLTFILVDKNFQNMGHGKQLLKTFVNKFNKETLYNSNSYISVKIDKTNDRNKKWYIDNGFNTFEKYNFILKMIKAPLVFVREDNNNVHHEIYYYFNLKNVLLFRHKSA